MLLYWDIYTTFDNDLIGIYQNLFFKHLLDHIEHTWYRLLQYFYLHTNCIRHVCLINLYHFKIHCVCMKLLKNSWHNKIPPFSQLRDAAHKGARHYKKRPLDIILMTFYFRLIGKHFELSNATKSTGNLTKTNLEDYSVLVIILSSLLSISVLVLVVGIVKKILKAYPIKRNTFRRENKGGELFKWKLNISLL